MQRKWINWIIFIGLSFIWGSSFLLMKIAMEPGPFQLSPYQVASLRMFFSGLALTPIAYKAFKEIPKDKLGIVILSGLLGSFIPAYLFCIAETKIDSALAGILNSLTPLFTIIVGIAFFKMHSDGKKIMGILLGLAGLALSVSAGKHIQFDNFSYSFLVIIATIFYGINVNMVGKFMHHIKALHIASFAFVFSMIPSGIILYVTGYLSNDFTNCEFLQASFAGGILGVINTSLASILFYVLVKRSGIVFASMVTYAIPFVSLVLGLFYKEAIHPLRILGLLIILLGVYIVNRRPSNQAKSAN